MNTGGGTNVCRKAGKRHESQREPAAEKLRREKNVAQRGERERERVRESRARRRED